MFLSIINKPYLDFGKFSIYLICVFWLTHCWFAPNSIEEKPASYLGIEPFISQSIQVESALIISWPVLKFLPSFFPFVLKEKYQQRFLDME